MRVYLTRDFLREGRVLEAEAHPLTGRPGWVQVNGRRASKHERLHGPGEWHADAASAAARARELLRVAVAENARRLDGLVIERARLASLAATVGEDVPPWREQARPAPRRGRAE